LFQDQGGSKLSVLGLCPSLSMLMHAGADQAEVARTPDHPSVQSWINLKAGCDMPDGNNLELAKTPLAKQMQHAMMKSMMEQLTLKLSDVKQQRQQQQQEEDVQEEDVQEGGSQPDSNDDTDNADGKPCTVALVRQFGPLRLGGLGSACALPQQLWAAEAPSSSCGWMPLHRQYTPLKLGFVSLGGARLASAD